MREKIEKLSVLGKKAFDGREFTFLGINEVARGTGSLISYAEI